MIILITQKSTNFNTVSVMRNHRKCW